MTYIDRTGKVYYEGANGRLLSKEELREVVSKLEALLTDDGRVILS
jgi:hypothetical protein